MHKSRIALVQMDAINHAMYRAARYGGEHTVLREGDTFRVVPGIRLQEGTVGTTDHTGEWFTFDSHYNPEASA